MDSFYLNYMHTTHLLTPISLFQTPTLSLSRARTVPHLLPTSPPSDDTQCQVCQSLCDEEKLLLSDICNAGWHMDCLLLTLTSWDMEMSLVYPSCPIIPGSTATLRFPSPILDPDSE